MTLGKASKAKHSLDKRSLGISSDYNKIFRTDCLRMRTEIQVPQWILLGFA